MKTSILFLFLAFTTFSFAQFSQLNLTISGSYFVDSNCYQLKITNDRNTFIEKTIYNGEDRFYEYFEDFDSLQPGIYSIRIQKCSNPEESSIVQTTTLQPNECMELYLKYYLSEEKFKLDSGQFMRDDTYYQEGQFNLSYINPNWIQNNSVLKSAITVGLSGYNLHPFTNHMGLLAGGGMGFSHYAFSKDTTFMNLNGQPKKKEYYNYINAHLDLKLRFTTRDIPADSIQWHGLTLDIGTAYYFPISFKHIGIFDNNNRLVNSRLHQFTDLRAYVDIGIHPVLLYAEYRAFDFVLGKYPEFPSFNFGLKLTIE